MYPQPSARAKRLCLAIFVYKLFDVPVVVEAVVVAAVVVAAVVGLAVVGAAVVVAAVVVAQVVVTAPKSFRIKSMMMFQNCYEMIFSPSD